MLQNDIRFAWRGIRRNPAFAALIIATMALGIGASTTMFSVIHAVFFRPLPFPNQDRLVTLWESDPERGVTRRRVSGSNFVDWEAQSSVFEAMGVLPNWNGPSWTFNASWTFNVVGRNSMERVEGIYASSGFFRVMGIQPILGRALADRDDLREGERNAVISHSYWQQQFGGDPMVLGRTIEVDTFGGGPFTVIGVMPAGFDFPRGAKIWLSLGDWGAGPLPPPDTADRGLPWYTVFARLKPGVTRERAASELTAIARRVSERHPSASRVAQVKVEPLRDSLVGTHTRALWTLFGAAGCVLLIACANVANLLLSRGVGRRMELLTRMALGATRWQLARQLTLESLLLCGLGAVAGVIAAFGTQRGLAGALESRPLIADIRMDVAVLAFAALLTVISGVICGVAPLVEWRAMDWRGRGQTESATSKRLRQALVVSEVALAVVLVAGAGLLIRTVANLRAVDVGFGIERILTVSMDVTTGPLRGHGAQFLEELIPRVAALPGVRSVGASTQTPLNGGPAEQAITREDRPPLPAAQSPQVVRTAVTPGYFKTLGIPLEKGRLFTESDTAAGRLVTILNRTAAERYWPGEDPIGKRFALGSRERFGSFRRLRHPGDIEWREIVGVVADVRSAGFASGVQPEMYYTYKQSPLYEPMLLVRTENNPDRLASAVRREIAAVNRSAVVTRVRTMEQVARESLAEPRLRAALVGLFSALALGLGMLGVYAITSYTVRQRTTEIAIRMALGAEHSHVSRMILGQALRLTSAGIVLGLAVSLVAVRSIVTLLFGVQPLDVLTLGGTCLLLLGMSALASYAPTRRATRVNPATALRNV